MLKRAQLIGSRLQTLVCNFNDEIEVFRHKERNSSSSSLSYSQFEI